MTLANYQSRHCQPLKGAEHQLAADALETAMRSFPDWLVIDNGKAICKTYSFPDYYHTMAFVNALAYVAHGEDHHPDLGVHYNRCVVRFSTHDADGVTDNDLICAAKAEALFADAAK
ncbi:4a-hydroxytetrahydrobiopterin dehydratase [Pseudomarimonas arenosa]|uniref:Putative pterin-4-alpha-carbinolamine dehydratase n=1 Tax=Pseudomarimonas arenosa TaxID=2774145 RepID=A0AAW3ZG31_9GAMM|nr:4a-hydroxytetrahydrobiopterin dehydratase [Pseudomarimonas arenosa]MBD8524539.1 4a-hydroxytetrahydrobiopterin dehydratase [Pseudomarimonas arenosa]